MSALNEAFNGLGAVLLPVVAGLLFEELTCAGLVRLLFAPRPKSSKKLEPKPEKGDCKCSH